MKNLAPPSRLTISQQHLTAIQGHVDGAQPHEACGFLGGVGERVEMTLPVANIARNPQVAFYMDPVEQLEALETLDERGLDLLGIYHSHPPGAVSHPSPTDISQASDPALIHFVITLPLQGGSMIFRAFRIVDGHAYEVTVVVIQSDGYRHNP